VSPAAAPDNGLAGLAQRRVTARAECDRGALVREHVRNRAPQALAGGSDNRDPAFESEIHG